MCTFFEQKVTNLIFQAIHNISAIYSANSTGCILWLESGFTYFYMIEKEKMYDIYDKRNHIP